MVLLGNALSNGVGTRVKHQGATPRSMSESVSLISLTITAELIKARHNQLVSQLCELEQAHKDLKDMQSVMTMTVKVRHELLSEELKTAQLDEYLSKYHKLLKTFVKQRKK